MFSIFTDIADVTMYGWLALDAETHVGSALHFFVEDTLKIFFMFMVLMTIVGFFRTWVAPEKVRQWINGRPLIIAYLIAVTFGALTPFCSCSSIPLFIAFLSAGIPLGVTMAFLITSPMVNEVAAILFGQAIGWEFMLAYVGTGMAVGVIGGMLVDALNLGKWVEPVAPVRPCCAKKAMASAEGMTLLERLQTAWDSSWDVTKSVWLYVIIGVGVGAAIHGYVPQEWFIENAGADNLWAVPLAVVSAIPLYANVMGSVPVAEVLIAKGLPVGTTLAFLMSTVAISLPELMILRRVLKPQMIGFFVVFLAIAFVVVGYGFNLIF